MNIRCPYCVSPGENPSDDGRTLRKHGKFYRSCDRKYVRRWRCMECKRTISHATFDPEFKQQTRHLNQRVFEDLASTNSIRRAARNSRISRDTVRRKLVALGRNAEQNIRKAHRANPLVDRVQFDDLETIEHTKKKPLSVITAVTMDRQILGIGVASMAAKGRLAKSSIAKYGKREDTRGEIRRELFKELTAYVSPTAQFESDQNPHYINELRDIFPRATHVTYKGRNPRAHGQGELKEGAHDPLFPLNHSFACFRGNVNRLIRRTWCTTKKSEYLRLHLFVAAYYHNDWIKTQRPPEYPRGEPRRPPQKNRAGRGATKGRASFRIN